MLSGLLKEYMKWEGNVVRTLEREHENDCNGGDGADLIKTLYAYI